MTTAPAREVDTPLGSATTGGSSLGSRLEFLDALRGLAALAVVIEHFSEQAFPSFATFTLERFRLGEFGVTLFFLCSGFIIPASLERRGSLRDFWTGRFFRLFPLYWSCLAAILLMHAGGIYRGLSGDYVHHWVRYSAANLTMVQDFLGVPLAMGQSWSLAYEMVFYLTVSVLFVGSVHRQSVPIAAVGITLSMLVGNHLRPWALKTAGPRTFALVLLGVVIAVALTLWFTRSKPLLVRLACSVAITVVVVLLFNRYEPTFQAAFFLGTMFVGTALYRWSRGEIADRTIALLGLLVVIAIIVAQMQPWSPWLNPVPITNYRFHQAEVITYTSAYVLFAVALLFRHKAFPRVLRYFGTISYSLYLVHSIVLYTLPDPARHPWLGVAGGVVVTVAASALTYRFIEKPSIALGRRLTKRNRARAAA